MVFASHHIPPLHQKSSSMSVGSSKPVRRHRAPVRRVRAAMPHTLDTRRSVPTLRQAMGPGYGLSASTERVMQQAARR